MWLVRTVFTLILSHGLPVRTAQARQFVLGFCFEKCLRIKFYFTVDEIEERDTEVAAQPGRNDISVCTCTSFCLREA